MAPPSQAVPQLIRDRVHLFNRISPQNFSSVLGLGPAALTDPSALSYDEDEKGRGTLRLRYRIPPTACLDGGRFPLSAYLAVFDEVSSWAILAEDRSRRPGVSTELYAEIGPAGRRGRGMRCGDVVDIKSR